MKTREKIETLIPIVYQIGDSKFEALPYLDLNRKEQVFGFLVAPGFALSKKCVMMTCKDVLERENVLLTREVKQKVNITTQLLIDCGIDADLEDEECFLHITNVAGSYRFEMGKAPKEIVDARIRMAYSF